VEGAGVEKWDLAWPPQPNLPTEPSSPSAGRAFERSEKPLKRGGVNSRMVGGGPRCWENQEVEGGKSKTGGKKKMVNTRLSKIAETIEKGRKKISKKP